LISKKTTMNHALILGFVWPEPNSSAAGSRMLQLIGLFLSKQWNVTFASAAALSPHMEDLQALGVSTSQIKINDSSFDDYIVDLQPDIVVFDRFMTEEQFGWRITKNIPKALRILNTEDLHCLRKTRQECFKKEKPYTIDDLLNNDFTKREIASIYRCDLSLMISYEEMNLLEKHFKIDKKLLFYLPFLYQPLTQKDVQNWPKFDDRVDFISIGNFRHEPNWQSVLYLKKTIWPIISAALPKVKLHVYGAYPPPKATQLNDPKTNFHIAGWTDDAPLAMKKAKVCLAPLQFGAGIKGKLALAMRYGTPSVTTNIGAEGMLPEDADWNGFVANTPETFAKAAIRLYTNQNIWQQSQQNGIEIHNTLFNKDKYITAVIERIGNIQENLSEHRTFNFIGNMLGYHTARSTEYMSRWIEEKNKPFKEKP